MSEVLGRVSRERLLEVLSKMIELSQSPKQRLALERARSYVESAEGDLKVSELMRWFIMAGMDVNEFIEFLARAGALESSARVPELRRAWEELLWEEAGEDGG